jgi:DnaK suppressor protein
VSKPIAKKAVPAKKSAAKAAKAGKVAVKVQPKAKATAKPAAKAAVKPKVKAPAGSKVAVKVTKAKPKIVKPAPKATAKQVKPAPSKVPQPAKTAKAPKAEAGTPSKSPKAARPDPAVAAPIVSPAASSPIKSSTPPTTRGRGKAAPAPVAPPAPIVGVTANRFADRFGTAPPARPVIVEHNRPPIKIDTKLVNVWKSKAPKDLNDAEILAMPESEYMNDKQLEFFRLRLVGLKDDLLSNAGETTEHLREDTTIVPDPADRATIEEEHALELRTRDRERKLLKKIAQSLARIESGDYGFCDETGEPIGVARLLARPTATLSLEAQQRREIKQKMFGD